MKYLAALLLTLVMCASSYGQGVRYIPTPPTGGPYHAPSIIYVVPAPNYYFYAAPYRIQPQPYYHGYLPYYRNHYHIWIRP